MPGDGVTLLGGRPVDIIGDPLNRRRTLYGKVDRQDLPGLYRAFDFSNPDQTVDQYVEETGKSLGAPVKVTAFVRLGLGEGVERQSSDFAAEVASMTGPKVVRIRRIAEMRSVVLYSAIAIFDTVARVLEVMPPMNSGLGQLATTRGALSALQVLAGFVAIRVAPADEQASVSSAL